MNILNWLEKLLPTFNTAIDPLIEGTLSKYDDTAKTALRSALTKIDGGADHLLAIYRTYESNHPLVQEAINEACKLLKVAGITLPNADIVETHIKAAIHDLASVFIQPEKTQDETPSENTPSDTTKPSP